MTGDLRVRQVSKAYGNTLVLRSISLTVPRGSLTAILGPSGCGKTTLLRLIAGFDQPDVGVIALGETRLAGPERALPPERRGIGYVAQEGALFPHLTVAANITFGLPWRERRRGARVAELLELVDLDPALARRYPDQLSGGQQQRVALARALAPRPGVVLLDEPFSSLDAGLREGTRRAVKRVLQATGTTALLVTHDQAEALSLAEEVAVMQNGVIVQAGPPEAVYQRPADVATGTFVGDAFVLAANVTGGIAECALGRLNVAPGDVQGAGAVLVRPEQIVIASAPAPGTVAASVIGSTFYGPTCLLRLRLSAGEEIVARASGWTIPSLGTTVWLRTVGDVTAAPMAETT